MNTPAPHHSPFAIAGSVLVIDGDVQTALDIAQLNPKISRSEISSPISGTTSRTDKSVPVQNGEDAGLQTATR